MLITMSALSARRQVPLFLGLMLCLVMLAPSSEGKTYKGAEYRTKASYLYGRFEIRKKAIGREGTLSSFFTYNDDYPNTDWNEIDIEILGRYTDDVQFNTITPGQINHLSHQWVNFNPAVDYHVYGFEWTPTSVAWFIDSVEVVRQTGAHIATLNLPQKIMMNVWNPVYSEWVGKWNEAVLPAFASYDWVRYASYTPGTGSVGSGNDFTPQWVDQFDAWDTTRWEKGSHTFGGNACDFIYDNAVFLDGKLILCLTKETAIGYVDNVAPSVLWARAEGKTVRLMFSEEVEQAGAETNTNYVIPRASVTGAQLLPDLKTVRLNVPGLDTVTTSAMIVQNVRDRWPAANPMLATAVLLIRRPPLAFPLKINVGGGAYQTYVADTVWDEFVDYGRLDGWESYFSGATIAGTPDQEIYRSDAVGLCEYKIRVPDGRYDVTLMMAENTFASAGERLMNIVVEGSEVESGLDLFARVGYRTAYEKTTVIDVSDGTIDLHFQTPLDYPLLNGITVTPLSSSVDERGNREPVPEGITVFPNYPNPFNGGTTVSFALPERGPVTLRIFDALGRVVREQSLGEFPQGTSEVFWDAHDGRGNVLPSGTYFCVVEGSSGRAMQKLLYLK